MFDFDELDERLPVKSQSSKSSKSSKAAASAVGPPSLESLLLDDSDAEEAPEATNEISAVPKGPAGPASTETSTDREIRSRPNEIRGRNTKRLHVPITPAVRGSFLPEDGELFMWMAQKCYLRQDMFLLGDPGPHLRLRVMRFAQQTGREVEYISITRDTTEADLKQRRETWCWFHKTFIYTFISQGLPPHQVSQNCLVLFGTF